MVVFDILVLVFLFVVTFLLNHVFSGFQQSCPRTYAWVSAVWMGFLAFLLVVPLWALCSGREEMTRLSVWAAVLLYIPLFSCYAPWYLVLGTIPYWLLYAVVSATCFGGWSSGGGLIGNEQPGDAWVFFWLWMWSVYPLLRGIWHHWKWIEEGEAGLPKHKVTNHPAALAAVSLGMMVGLHYLFSRNKNRT